MLFRLRLQASTTLRLPFDFAQGDGQAELPGLSKVEGSGY